MQLCAPHHRFINAQCYITRGSSITYPNGAAEQVKKKLADHGTVQHPAPSIAMLHRGYLSMHREMGVWIVWWFWTAPPSTQQPSNSQRCESTVRACPLLSCSRSRGVGAVPTAPHVHCPLSTGMSRSRLHVERRKVARQWSAGRPCVSATKEAELSRDATLSVVEPSELFWGPSFRGGGAQMDQPVPRNSSRDGSASGPQTGSLHSATGPSLGSKGIGRVAGITGERLRSHRECDMSGALTDEADKAFLMMPWCVYCLGYTVHTWEYTALVLSPRFPKITSSRR